MRKIVIAATLIAASLSVAACKKAQAPVDNGTTDTTVVDETNGMEADANAMAPADANATSGAVDAKAAATTNSGNAADEDRGGDPGAK
jgi:hypothetical protein